MVALGGQSRQGAAAWTIQRRYRRCFIDLRRTQVAETQEKEQQAEALNKQAQGEQQPVVPNGRSGRIWSIAGASLALLASGAVAIYTVPEFNMALPNVSSFISLPNVSSVAELFQREPAPPDPITVALKDIRSSQLRYGDTLQENGAVLQQNTAILQQDTAMLQQGATVLESLKQGSTAQQMNMKIISSQLASLIARVDSLQNSVAPLTTSSIPQPAARAIPLPGARSIPLPTARARLARTLRKTTARLPNEPLGPVSVGGAPLIQAPAAVPARQRFSAN
jgi:hypothetical protein